MFKSYLLKKPIGLDLYYGKAGHSVNLIGYKKIMEGDSVLVDMSQKEWVKFEKGNPLIGATAWITKDSNSANLGTTRVWLYYYRKLVEFNENI